jgi:hypothetical protein
MPATIRFHLDENVSSAIAAGLRRRGIDVTTTLQAGLLSAGDEKQLDFAASDRHVLVTYDADLLRLHSQGVPHFGIAYSPKGKRTVGELLYGLIMISECLAAEEMMNHVEYL